jgi:hypothetical protein
MLRYCDVGAYMCTIGSSPWWTKLFIIYNDCLYVMLGFLLKHILSDVNIAIPALFLVAFFMEHFLSSLHFQFVCVLKAEVSGRHHLVGHTFYLYSHL